MSSPYTASHWDQRYAGDDYRYGTDPNDFLREQLAALAERGRVLCLGDGEGRNSVFLAEQGCTVVALDASAVGLAKAARLASARGVALSTVHADLADFEFAAGAWDGVVSLWCHLPTPLRRQVHRSVVAGLRPGGALLLEAYTPAQLAFATGGPRDPDLLPTLAQLSAELEGLVLEIGREREREVAEGRGHGGRSAVVQILARRPA